MSGLIRIDPEPPRAPERRGFLVRGPVAPVFVEAGALGPADAIAFLPSGGREARAFDRMRRAGVIRREGANWWLDIVAYQADADARSRRAIPYLIFGSVLAALLATLFYVDASWS